MCKFCEEYKKQNGANRPVWFPDVFSVSIGNVVSTLNFCPECGKELKESQRIDTENLVREIESLIAENRKTLERLNDRMETGKW